MPFVGVGVPGHHCVRSAGGFRLRDSAQRCEPKNFRFEEKPKDPKLLDELRIPPNLLKELGRPADAELYQGSMGIYVFNRQILIDALANDHDDFGKHIIPGSLQKYKSLPTSFRATGKISEQYGRFSKPTWH
jgi:hypothetical protein